MKKKIVMAMLTAAVCVALVGCGSSSSKKETEGTTQSTQSDTKKAETPKQETKKDLPDGNYSEKGNGTMVLYGPSGSTENGKKLLFYLDKGTSITQFTLSARDFDGSLLSFVYIDGKLVSKEQLADTDQSIDMQGDSLKAGDHKVEVLQYEGNDPTKPYVTYKAASYEVQNK